MKAFAIFAMTLSTAVSAQASIDRLVGEFNGTTNIGTPCTILISRPDQVQVEVSSGNKHLKDVFEGGPILEQLDRQSPIVVAQNTTGSSDAVLQRSSVRISLDGDLRVTRVRMDWSESVPFEFAQHENIDCDLQRTN
jgi:hypothetical protein